jgi:surface antigen
MAKIGVVVLFTAALMVTGSAAAVGSWDPPHYWNASAYAHMPMPGQHATWASDFGIVGGHCNASLVGAVVSGTDGDDQGTALVATLHGLVLGDAAGLNAIDRGCMGHALELAPSFFEVHWVNPETHVSFTLTPMRRITLHGNQCRLFSAEATIAGDQQVQRATACRFGRGEWYML